MTALARYRHPLVQPAPVPAPVPAGVVPRCSARDWVSGAQCSKVAGHCGSEHVSADQDFEIRWPRA